MGQSGLTTGLALYEDLKALRRLWAGEWADEGNARQSVATTVRRVRVGSRLMRQTKLRSVLVGGKVR
jgi:hypothetical protein